jgi:hypothetical protein
MKSESPFWLALYTGLTSLFAMLLYRAIEDFLALPAREQLRDAETIALVTIGILFVIEPLLSRIRISYPGEPPHAKGGQGFLVHILAFVVIVLVGFCDGLLHQYIGHTISPRGWAGIEELASSLIGPTVITLAWLHGGASGQARKYGFVAGILVGILFVGAGILELRSLVASPEDAQSDSLKIALTDGLILLWPMLTSYALSGYFGGLAADRGWGRHAWQRIAVGLAMAAAIEVVLEIFIFHFLFGTAALRTIRWWSFASLMVPEEIGNVGWALGVILWPNRDAFFQSDRPKRPAGFSKR